MTPSLRRAMRTGRRKTSTSAGSRPRNSAGESRHSRLETLVSSTSPGARAPGQHEQAKGAGARGDLRDQGICHGRSRSKSRAVRTRRRAWGLPVNMGLPARFEAVGEALASGSGSADACAVVGRDLARDGASLHEGLEALRTTYQRVRGLDPAYDDVLALSLAWSESTLGYLHQISCADPMTGLASLAHLRSRLADLYRGQGPEFGRVRHRYALVVADLPGDRYGAEAETEPLTRSLRLSAGSARPPAPSSPVPRPSPAPAPTGSSSWRPATSASASAPPCCAGWSTPWTCTATWPGSGSRDCRPPTPARSRSSTSSPAPRTPGRHGHRRRPAAPTRRRASVSSR